MKIEIINPCMELQRMGIAHGDILEATPGSELTKSMYFERDRKTGVAWPENYRIVPEENTECDAEGRCFDHECMKGIECNRDLRETK